MKSFDLLSNLKSKLRITRRGFLQGALAVGASATIAGCSKVDTDLSDKEVEVPIDAIVYGSTGHNCGARCITKAHVSNGRIIKFTTDDTSTYTDGSKVSADSENCTQSRACAKCRGYKHRLYHPGRLKYALKQTIKRGDLSGFVRVPYATALDEVAKKHKAITDKYGSESFHSLYACGTIASSWQGGGYTGIWTGMNGIGGKYIGGQLPYTDDYSFHQKSFFGNRYTGYKSETFNAPVVAQHVKNLVLWGSNILSTVNEKAYAWIRSVEKMKERNSNAKVYFIGPEFVDTGVTLADEWIKIKPYTDVALMMGMLYHMIENTFNTDGTIKTTPMLDVKYLDTMVYGFFASPEYWVHIGVKEVKDDDNNVTTPEVKATGEIVLTEPTANLEQYNKIDAVPVGKSLASYIMGNGDYVKGVYEATGDNATYTSAKFVGKARGAACDYSATAGNATKYMYKKDFKLPKDPAWASAITGISEAKIIELAEIYAKPENHPVASTWAGGQTKQAEGVITFFAMHSMMLISKVWGETGNVFDRAFGGSRKGSEGNLPVKIERNVPANPGSPVIGCTQWLSGIKFAFGDQLTAANGYTGKFVPDHSVAEVNTRKAYYDDSGVKSLVKWKRDNKGNLIVGGNGFYEYEKDGSSNPIYSGVRFILNSGGNILINQHMNPNDSREVFESLPLASTNPTDADTLCLVSLDNFLSPSPRWSDYIFPATTNWEQEDILGISLGNSIYVPAVSKAPGESKAPYDFTNELLKAYAKIDTRKADLSTDFTGGVADKSLEAHTKDAFAVASSKAGILQGKTWDEYLKNPFLPRVPNDSIIKASKSKLRTNLDTYLAQAESDRTTKPFVKVDTSSDSSKYINQSVGLVGLGNAGYGDMGGGEFSKPDTAPDSPARFTVYSPMFVWRYENRYSKFHGHLAESERGMKNQDFETDPIVYPIPMYFNYEDYFMEAYGKENALPAVGNRFLLTTTHDRYRVHSSQAENPYLRELTHRTVGGDLYSGDDWNEYALLGAEPAEGGKLSIPRLNKAIAEKKLNATYSEIWMNDQDGSDQGIRDGDLVEVSNAIGAVHCVARLSKRCVKGFLGLHQGCWYDPDPVTGVDVGGNCNTLMASRPSRVDHGNAQQSAMVSIKRVVV